MELFLTYRRSDFLEIYYRNNNGSWLFNKTTYNSFLLLSLSLIGLAISIAFDYAQHIIPIIVILFGFILFDVASKFYAYFKWRKTVNAYLDVQEKYKSHKIQITSNYFSIEQDNDVTIERFDQITICEINTDFIHLSGTNTYLIPKKSMSDQEYANLTNILKESIKNIQ